jgi:hypothetical protein
VPEFNLTSGTIKNILFIPRGDLNRSHIFSDPLINILKKIYIKNNINDELQTCEDTEEVFIDIKENKIAQLTLSEMIDLLKKNL